MAVLGADIINYAKKFLGTPYVWGGNSLTKGVDCSGFIQQVFKNFGIETQRTTYNMINDGQSISLKGLRAGDLVFFETNGKQAGPDHIAIYMGNGKMIHAPRPGKSVEITDMSSGYWVDRFAGGRRMSGVKASGASALDYADDVEQAKRLTPEELASNYGWAISFLESVPELDKKFDQAVKENWTTEKFQAELRDTKWWKETSDTRRQAQVMKTTDPASWQASINATRIMVAQLASEVGAAVPPKQMEKVVRDVIELGLEEDGIRNILGKYVTFTKKGTLLGEAGMHQFNIKKYAASQGVELSDDAIKNQAQLIVRKLATTQDFESQIREQAKSLLPAYADRIDAGETVEDIAEPYRQTMIQELQLPAASVTVTDPLIKGALNGLDASGKPGGMTIPDFQNRLRNDPRWRGSDKAMGNTMAVGAQVLRDMGLLGGGGS